MNFFICKKNKGQMDINAHAHDSSCLYVVHGTRRLSDEGENLFPLLILSKLFSPLQGLFNILVYCRPHVNSLRRKHPDFSWFKANWITVKTGGDNNSSGRTRRDRQSNLIGNTVFLERLERDHAQRMRSIRQNKHEVVDTYEALLADTCQRWR